MGVTGYHEMTSRRIITCALKLRCLDRVIRRHSQQRVMYLHCTLLLTGGAPGSHTTGVLGFCTGFNVPGSTHEVLQVKAIVGNYPDF